MANYPNFYPTYINGIIDPYEQNEWKKKYLDAYQESYNETNSQWYGLKGTMYGVTMLAFTLFASIMTATKLERGAFAVASTITIAAIGTTAAICTMVYYGWLADENQRILKNFGAFFATRYEIVFNEAMVKKPKAADQNDEPADTNP